MFKVTPERPVPVSGQRPTPDFIWPPPKEQLTPNSAETVRRRNSYLDRPTGLERPLTGTETWQSRAPRPRADFNWPPTEEEPAAGGFAGTNSVAAGEGTAAATVPVISRDASWIPANIGQGSAREDEEAVDAVPTRSVADGPEYVGDSISVIPVAPSEAAFDGIGTGDWAADIARVQAVIERVAEKVEWRTTRVTGR